MNKKMMILLIGILLFIPLKVNAGRGCCSHHGGVSGCSSSGRQICNDGTLSPSCTCTPVITYTYGCTDKTAINYDENADRDDGSCKYYIYETVINYDNNANKDDESYQFLTSSNLDEDADYKKNNNSIISGVIFEVLVVSGFLFLLKKINR